MKVRDIMAARVVSLPRSATVTEAARTMRDEKVGSVVVVEDGKLVGIITDRQITHSVTAAGDDPREVAIGDVMHEDFVPLEPDMDLLQAMRLQRELAMRRLPVVENGTPVGIVSVSDIAAFARAAEDAGADAISLINTLPAMVIDINTRKPVLSNVVGGLSGPAIHPVAVKLVWESASAVQIPVIGIGGITGPEQAIEFIIAGAAAVAVGTANFTDPETPLKVIEGIELYLEKHGFASVESLVGTLET
jgi:CBS domain-containing protein